MPKPKVHRKISLDISNQYNFYFLDLLLNKSPSDPAALELAYKFVNMNVGADDDDEVDGSIARLARGDEDDESSDFTVEYEERDIDEL